MMFGLLFTHENVCMKITFLEFEESQKKAADISERMKLQVLLVTTQFTQLLTPILDLLKPTDDMGAAMDRARVVAYALAVAMAGFVSVQVINGITSIAGAIKVLAGMFYASAGAAAVSTAAIAVDFSHQSHGCRIIAVLFNALHRF
jgi:predicted polyphosphate/ATP-dependent NAD kinase